MILFVIKIIHLIQQLYLLLLKDIKIKNVPIYINGVTNNERMQVKCSNTMNIIKNDFAPIEKGMMLINWASKVENMLYTANHISNIYQDIPVIVLSTITRTYFNKQVKTCKVKNIQKFIDEFNGFNKVIIIANRYSNRGINYTNSDYSRFITHQVSFESNNYTNFIQKCRLLGNRPNTEMQPILYCLTHKMLNFVQRLRTKIEKMLKILNEEKEKDLRDPSLPKVTVKYLKSLCKLNNIKRYSKKRKNELIVMLNEAKITI
jgi:hypothetical protein